MGTIGLMTGSSQKPHIEVGGKEQARTPAVGPARVVFLLEDLEYGGTQRQALDAEFTAIKNEITRIGSNTTYNGSAVFSGTATDIYLSDGTTTGSSPISVTVGTMSDASVGFTGTPVDLTADSLTSAANAQTAITDVSSAIANIAADRGNLGAVMNRLQSASNVISNQVQNLSSAEDGIRAADIGQEVANLSKFNILQQTGITALQQSNQIQQSVLKLLQ